jgi:hypothetical protein
MPIRRQIPDTTVQPAVFRDLHVEHPAGRQIRCVAHRSAAQGERVECRLKESKVELRCRLPSGRYARRRPYQGFGPGVTNTQTGQLYGIPSLVLILVVLLLGLLIGIAVGFVGLAFHHERRHRERLRELREHEAKGLAAPPVG